MSLRVKLFITKHHRITTSALINLGAITTVTAAVLVNLLIDQFREFNSAVVWKLFWQMKRIKNFYRKWKQNKQETVRSHVIRSDADASGPLSSKVQGVHACARPRAETERALWSTSGRGWLKWSTLNPLAFAAAVLKKKQKTKKTTTIHKTRRAYHQDKGRKQWRRKGDLVWSKLLKGWSKGCAG